jgi:hypothetical protein
MEPQGVRIPEHTRRSNRFWRQSVTPAAWRTFSRYSIAQRALYTAEDARLQSETDAIIATIAIYKALGGGWTLAEIRK